MATVFNEFKLHVAIILYDRGYYYAGCFMVIIPHLAILYIRQCLALTNNFFFFHFCAQVNA